MSKFKRNLLCDENATMRSIVICSSGSENERYTKLMQYYTVEEECLKIAKQTSSNEEFIEMPNIRNTLNKIDILFKELL